jgi:hypothetical protein
MTCRIAPLIGKTIRYHRLENNDISLLSRYGDDFPEQPKVCDVLLWKSYHECILVKSGTFDYLYFELDDEWCALKEDCIEYTIYRYEKTADEYSPLIHSL